MGYMQIVAHVFKGLQHLWMLGYTRGYVILYRAAVSLFL